MNLCWNGVVLKLLLRRKSLERTTNACDVSVRAMQNVHKEKRFGIHTKCSFQIHQKCEKEELVLEMDDFNSFDTKAMSTTGFGVLISMYPCVPCLYLP